MGNLKSGDAQAVITGDGRIAFRLPVDGRLRTFHCDPKTALGIGVGLCTAAVKLGPPSEEGFERVTDIKLLPYRGSDAAFLALSTEAAGPYHFMVDAKILNALASAAEAALEHGRSGGSA